MEIFYTTLITLNATCAFLILMSGIRQQKNYLVALAFLNILALGFNYFSWQLHSATILSDAIKLSHIHTGLAIVALPLIIFTFGSWCKQRHTLQFTYFYLFIAIILSAVNYFSDYSLRYGPSAELISYTSMLGDNLVMLKGESSLIFKSIHLIYASNTCLLIWFASRLFNQKKQLLSIFLIIFLCLQLFINYAGYKLDSLEWPLFYIGGLPITILSIFCTALISSLYKTKSIQLDNQRQQQKKLECAITKLAHGLSTLDSNEFYLELSSMIFDLSNADFILLGVVDPREINHVETLVALRKGVLIDNISYSLKGTPCEVVYTNEVCVYKNNVAQLFPEAKLLSNKDIESYVGVPLLNQKNEAIGILALLYNAPSDLAPSLINVLKIFASRVGAEIRRDELAQYLKSMAYFDYQSKLPNRAKLLEIIDDKYYECKRDNSNALFMLVDLDHFADVERQYGHEVGDQVIKLLGERLQHHSSTELFIARNSGDEFAFVLSNFSGDIAQLLNVQWQAIKAIIGKPYIIGNRKIKMECSMGAVVFPLQTESQFDVISCAEHSILRAKKNGRNRYTLFDPDILAKIDLKKDIEADLVKAMQQVGQLSLVYQAKVTKNGCVVGSEALLRWAHPVKGNISPVDFIAVAEESGLIHSLGKWVINEVCRQIKTWLDQQQPTYKVSINVAASQFNDPDFIQCIFAKLSEYQVDPKWIEIELTESALLTNMSTAICNLSQLREKGISIALDDFGTGFSSLSYLQDLPLDVLKIDKSFIDNITQIKSAELIRSIISICSHMNFKTVAEGTENIEQVNALVAMGCDYFQGYYFSHPLPAKEFIGYCVGQQKLS